MNKKSAYLILFISLIFSFNISVASMERYCSVPPFIVSGVKPNVLIILDNSNSMDEDFYGNAVGSYSSASKMVIAKKALISIINKLQDKLRIGLMTYRIDNVESYHIHNAFYFTSYDPKSYCPNPPHECIEYCQTLDPTLRNNCSNSCTTQNPLFDVDYFDEIITNYPLGSEERDRYCRLVYPKIQRYPNPSDPTHYIYYKQALPFYSDSNFGNAFCYSQSYNPNEGTPYDYYECYQKKTGTNDNFANYSDFWFYSYFYPTDTDYALGYYDFGRRLSWVYVGKTWFSNSSPGDGYLHVKVNDLIDEYGNITATYDALITKLDPKENDETGYMSCTLSNKNKCDYIISAGLTPTTGTLQSAIDYLSGDNSPIKYRCQKTFIVYVTDGLPSVDEYGNPQTTDELLSGVLQKLDDLRNLTVNIDDTEYNLDIQTYILGVGLTEEAKSKLDIMAQHGGTDVDGHAYYADNPDQLINALNKIFSEILKKTSSGTSASILSNKRNKGSVLAQALFFPEKRFTNSDTTYIVTWIGNIYGYWFYTGKNIQNIREDSNTNLTLDVTNEHDYIIEFDIDNNSGNTVVHRYKSKSDGTKGSELSTSPVQIEKISHLFKAGDLLRDVSGSDRTIYIEKDGSLVPFVSSNVIDDLLYLLSDDCLTSKDQLVSYIRGESDHGCRSRKTDDDKIWKLGDIIYSTPKVVDYRDYSVMFVGANDGMLHAFKIGKIRKDGLSINQKAKLCKNLDDDDCPNYSSSDLKEIGKELWAFIPKNVMPYLKYLADPNYCHMYFVDLSPYIIEEDTNKDGIIDKRILIGGLRFGGAAGCHKESGDEQVWCSSNNQIVPEYEDCNPNDMSDCVGLSSYFALDITDPENPKFLWEFADPYLGFSFSGPAYLKRGDYRYVMFVSGPTNYKGEADGQDLNIFILGLENDFKFGGVLKIDGQGKEGFVKNSTLSEYNNAFGGRLFTEGIDGNGDGKTDIVFFGVSTKTDDGWKGNVLGVKLTNDDDPTQWKIVEVFKDLIKPVTAKIEYMRCFEMNYIYFGTGRWFYKTDEIGDGDSDKEKLYGIRIDGCLQNDDCSLDSVNSNSNNACQALQDGDLTTGWTIDQDLLPIGSGYFKERNITDPTPINSKNSNIIVFTTMQPSGDLCGFGGRTRLWALNCATGANINDNSCGGYVPKVPEGKLLLQLSLGNIEEQKLSEITSKHSDWFTGIPPESATPFASGSSPIGRILLWLEK